MPYCWYKLALGALITIHFRHKMRVFNNLNIFLATEGSHRAVYYTSLSYILYI